MTPFLSFLLKANLALTLLYAFYFLCFRRDTFYGKIRWYLLVSMIATLIFPLINIATWLTGSPVVMEISENIPDVNSVTQYVFVRPQIENTVEPIAAQTVPVSLILWWCWLSVFIFMLGQRLFQLACIIRLRRRYPRVRYGSSVITAVEGKIQPFSFVDRIFLNPSLYAKDELDEIVAHEQIHCRQRHTIDILLSETLVCLCWFNPVAWLLRHDLKQNIEYYTDRMTLRSGFDRRQYQYSLLQVSDSGYQIVNHFYFNNLKKRIIMMNKKETPRILTAKYLLVIPALAAAFLTVQISGLQAAKKYSSESILDRDTGESTHIVVLDTLVAKKGFTIVDTIDSEKKNSSYTFNNVSKTGDIKGRVTHIKADSTVFRGNPLEKALVLIDGKESSVDTISAQDIESISILKDKTATRLYGSKGENGVVLITTKSSKPHLNVITKTGQYTTCSQETVRLSGTVTAARDGQALPGVTVVVLESETQPEDKLDENPKVLPVRSGKTASVLFIVDGTEVSNMENLSPESIQSMEIFKDQSAIDKYGDKGKNGVVVITTKK